LKILIVTDTYRPRINGVVTSIDTFANEFRKLGHEAHIVAPEFPVKRRADHMGEADKMEEFVTRIKSHYLFFDPEDRLPNPYLPSSRIKISEEILNHKYDVIHTQTPFTLGVEAVKWAKRMDCPIVHTYHTMFEAYIHYFKFMPKWMSMPIAKGISKWYCDKMDLNITPSSQMKDLLLSYGVVKPVEVNPTGIKMDKFKIFHGDDFRKKFGIPADTTLFLFMGRIGHEKNIPFLFKVLKKVLAVRPNTKLIVAGKGPAEDEVKAAAIAEGVLDNIIFLGYFEPQDWVNCYAAADLFTFSSITETQGLVVTEAMAVGTPVVAVGEMGVAEVMEGNKGGILVRLNVDEFTAAVFKLLDDKVLYAAKKVEAFEYAKEWSAEAMAKKMLERYARTILDYKSKVKK
jgi:glycosyltransferase involved in cell wall biosynthesis